MLRSVTSTWRGDSRIDPERAQPDYTIHVQLIRSTDEELCKALCKLEQKGATVTKVDQQNFTIHFAKATPRTPSNYQIVETAVQEFYKRHSLP
jgi:chaperone required for assembly of F1-ATPase